MHVTLTSTATTASQDLSINSSQIVVIIIVTYDIFSKIYISLVFFVGFFNKKRKREYFM